MAECVVVLLLQIDVLSGVVQAVAGRCEVYLDGGVRTGSDVFKAVALGAKAVFVGRPIIYALAHSVSLRHLIRLICLKHGCICLSVHQIFITAKIEVPLGQIRICTLQNSEDKKHVMLMK